MYPHPRLQTTYRDDLVEQYADRPPVDREVVALVEDDLGCSILRGATDGPSPILHELGEPAFPRAHRSETHARGMSVLQRPTRSRFAESRKQNKK